MARSAASRAAHFRLNRSMLLLLIAAVLVLYTVIPQLKYFHNALASWRHADLVWLVLAFGMLLASYCLAAGVYVLLAWKRLNYAKTVVMQAASMFANRLLPAGVGALSVNYLYLRQSRHSKPQAIAVATLNNFLGFLGNVVLLVILSLSTHSRLLPAHKLPVRAVIYVVLAVLVIAVVLLWWRRLRRSISRAAVATIYIIIEYRHRLQTLLLGLIVSMLLAACYTYCLLACALALGVHVAFVPLFIVMTVGVVGSVVVPTPGGLGGAEAGLVAALVLYGVSSKEALATALLYRLFTYWLPLLLGAGALIFAERRQYI